MLRNGFRLLLAVALTMGTHSGGGRHQNDWLDICNRKI
jgi:hypothetical protein